MPADGAEDRPSAAEELAAQKREQRLRKFRELHLKRVSGGAGPGRASGTARSPLRVRTPLEMALTASEAAPLAPPRPHPQDLLYLGEIN